MNPQDLRHRYLKGRKCTIGCAILDRLLDGGIPCRSITEVVSESGCGKTQLCLQLLLHAQLPTSSGGLAASSLYIHSEFPFPLRRLQQLSSFFLSSYSHLLPLHHNPLDLVFVHPAHSADHLLDLISKTESILLNSASQTPIRLIVIDSIAALFRSEFENSLSDMKRRSSLFFRISGKLKLLAERFDLAVMITNQVVDLVETSDGPRIGNLDRLYTSGRVVSPALGLSWANCVNSRLFLSRTEEFQRRGLEDGSEENKLLFTTRRRLGVIFAPHLPECSCEFVILREGVFGVDLNED